MKLTLESERLVLQVMYEGQENFIADFYRRNWEFLAQWEPNMSIQNADPEIQRNGLHYELEQLKQGRFLRYWYAPKEQPDYLYGTICFQNILPYPLSHCEIGYKQDQAQMGHGYATEAAETAILHLFTECGIHRIEALAECQNVSSIALLERLNFQKEGIAKEVVYLRDAWRDCIRYALLNRIRQE